MKEIVKDLEQAIFGDYDNDESLIEGLDKDILEEEELDRRFKNLIGKKRRESLREYLKESTDANSQDRVNALKEYLKESKDANPQERVNALKKKLNNLFKKISEYNNNNNDNDDSKDNNNDNDNSEDSQISNFVDEVLKKVSKEIVNDDAKEKSNQKSKKNITERIKKVDASENLFNKQIKEILELDKKYIESRANTDKTIKELNAEIKDKEEVSKKANKALKEHYINEAQRASKEIEKYNKIINDNLDMSSEKSEIINKLIKLHSLIKIYNLNKIDNNLKANENINNTSLKSDIMKLEKRLRRLFKKSRGVFTSQKEFAKLLTFLAQLLTNNMTEPSALAHSSKKLISDTEQLINDLYNNE